MPVRGSRSVLVASLCVLELGCVAHHRLVSAEPEPIGEYHHVTSHAFLWGALETQTAVRNCLSNAIDEVRVRTSLLQSLATVLTLGIWQPATLDYKCRAEEAQPGEFGK